MQRITLFVLAVLTFGVVLPWVLAPKPSEDLLALWLAGQSLAAGRPELIYAASEPVFTMRPPSEEWLVMARDLGHEGQVYPYLYPPLWAALVAPLTGWVGFSFVVAVVSGANALLLIGCSWLAWRALRDPMPVITFVLLGQILFYGTTVGSIALLQNQPQILVAFLMLLTIERSRAGAQVAAGSALALAAAIKLFPVLFAPILLATGHKRAFAAFVVVGAGLGLASVAAAGWPLHADFLAAVSAVAGTVLRASVNYSIDAALAQALIPDEAMTIVTMRDLAGVVQSSWIVVARPEAWIVAGRAALLAALGFTLFRARRLPDATLYGQLWPAALIALTLLMPLAWSYYFIAPLAFAPTFLSRFGTPIGTALLLLIYLPISNGLMRYTAFTEDALTAGMLSELGLASMSLLLAAFAFDRQVAQNGRTTLPE